MNIGLIVNNLGASQLSYDLINQANKISFEGQHECFFFPRNLVVPCLPVKCTILNLTEIHDFQGLLLSFNLQDTQLLAETKNPARKVFYVWDLEWLRGKLNFVENLPIYTDKRLELYCRSHDHQKAIENYCNVLSHVVEDVNLLEIINESIDSL